MTHVPAAPQTVPAALQTDAEAPLASVLILSYNQAALVAPTLEGALAQKTSFPFEIVVGDDASQDGTADVYERLGKGFPNLRVIRHPQNLGLVGNFYATLAQCRGRYIALLGGDDIWTAPDKLEKQVSFLRSHPDYTISHTHYEILDHATSVVSQTRHRPNCEGSRLLSLLKKGCFIAAPTAVFDSARLTQEDKAILARYRIEDYPMWLILAQRGKVHFVPDVCLRYRMIANSISRPGSFEKKAAFKDEIRKIKVDFCKRTPGFSRLLHRVHVDEDIAMLRLFMDEGELEKGRAFVRQIPLGRILRSPRLMRYLMKFFRKR